MGMACASVAFGGLHLLRCKSTSVSATFLPSSKARRLSFPLTKKRSLPKLLAAADNVGIDESVEPIISGEWPENFSLLNYDDLRAFLEPEIFKEKMQPSSVLGEVMSAIIRTATVDQTLEEIDCHFEIVSGLPVIDEEFRCIGVISKKDKFRAPHGLDSKVGEVMSSPAITLTPEKTVLDAAALMLRQKIHRIPIINDEGQLIGIVTRTDIFKVLEE